MAKDYFKTKEVKLRLPQHISLYGPGSIMTTVNRERLLICAADFWKRGRYPKSWEIKDKRLQQRLNVDSFFQPPIFNAKHEDDQMRGKSIRAFRFPRWHYCQKCSKMKKLKLSEHLHLKKGKYSYVKNPEAFCDGELLGSNCAKDKKNGMDLQQLVQSRFMSICKNGHLEDFPYSAWVHDYSLEYGDDNYEHVLKFEDNDNLSSIRVTCITCKKNGQSVTKVFGGVIEKGYGDNNCSGNRPWAGFDKAEKCSETLKVVQQGASNAYFPVTKSSIYLPKSQIQFTKEIDDLFKQDNDRFIGLDEENETEVYLDDLKAIAKWKKLDLNQLTQAFTKKYLDLDHNDDSIISEEDFRYQEYEAILNEESDEEKELVIKKQDISKYSPTTQTYFNNIYKIDKLREIKALYGFTRLDPHDSENSSMLDDKRIQTSVVEKEKLRWCPATEVRGEGIFIEFDTSKIDNWIEDSKKEFENTMNRTTKNYNNARLNLRLEERIIRYKFYLLHTFSHLLIKQLCYDCGYGSTELKERIYCDQKTKNTMNGVLIYTASGDSEGSYGGLVRQCEPFLFDNILNKAVRSSMWCSYDPLCLENESQGTDSSNIGSCYACTLLPETSCEEGNRLLNRTLISGSIENKSLSYFKELIE